MSAAPVGFWIRKQHVLKEFMHPSMILQSGQFYTAWQVRVETEISVSFDLTSPLVETLKPA